MLTIRLQRTGRKNQASFRIVLAEKYRAASKKVVEILGHYNPRTKEFGVKDQERLNYWITQHAELSPTVHNLFVSKGLLNLPKVKAWKPKQKPAEAKGAETPAPQVAPAVPTETPPPAEAVAPAAPKS